MDEHTAATRGPDYDWKHEAEHYQQECDRLRALLGKVEASSERIDHENVMLRRQRTELLAFVKKWRDFNIEGDSKEQDEYDTELNAVLKKAEGA